MKHLKKFEFYFYEEDMEPEMRNMTSYGEEEEAGEEDTTHLDRYKRGDRGEMSRHELELRYPELSQEDDDDDYESEEDHMYGGDSPFSKQRPSGFNENFRKKVSSFEQYNQSRCRSNDCEDCGCGDEKTLESKKSKGVSYKKSGLKHPEKADRNKDKKISGWEGKVGKEIQKSIEKQKKEKPSDKSKNDTDNQKVTPNKSSTKKQDLPPDLKKAIASGIRD